MNHIERIKVEKKELDEKILEMEKFLEETTIDGIEYGLLTTQYHIMVSYSHILNMRLERTVKK